MPYMTPFCNLIHVMLIDDALSVICSHVGACYEQGVNVGICHCDTIKYKDVHGSVQSGFTQGDGYVEVD